MTEHQHHTTNMSLEEPITCQIQQDESSSAAVIRAIAAIKNCPATAIEPLAEWLNPDALDRIITHGEGATVQFEYVGFSVTVDRQSVTVQDSSEV